MGFFGKVQQTVGSKSQRKYERKTKRADKAQHTFQLNQAGRAMDNFMEDSQRQRLMMNERLAARGMAGGTHAAEESRVFEDMARRQLATLSENKSLAELGKDINSYGYKVQKRLKPLQIIDDALGLAEDVVGMGMGFGGAATGGAGGISQADMEAAIW